MTQAADPPEVLTPSRLLIRVTPEPTHLLRARERLRDYLDQQCADEEAIDQVVLAVDEACTNALRHSGTEQEIEIRLGFEADDLIAEVRDHGRGFDVTSFDPGKMPDPMANDGRGLYMISRLVDEMQLDSDGGLVVRMVKRGVRRPDPIVGDRAFDQSDGARDSQYWQLRRRAVIEEMGEAFASLDWEYRIVSCNQAALSLYGLAFEEVRGRSLWDVFPNAVDLPVGHAIRRAMQFGISSIEEFVSPATGHWLECRIYPTSSGVSLFVRDIDERKRKELERHRLMAELAASEARFRALFEHSPDGVFLTRPDGSIDVASPAACSMFGYSLEELKSLGWRDLLEEDDPRLAAMLALRRQSGRAIAQELTGIRKNGERLPIEVDSVVLPGDSDASFVLARDISARKRSEESLRRQADLLRLSFDAILLWQLDGTIETWNRGAEELYGFSAGEAVGRGPHELLKTIHPLPWEQIRASLHAQGSWEGEITHVASDGREIVVLSRQQLIRSEDGIARVLETNRDVTERKRAEAALRESEVEKAAQTERNRLARDLHDSVTQALFASTMKAEALAAVDDPERSRQALEELRRLNRGALAQMRTLLIELRDGGAEDVPIEQLLRNVVQATESRASVDILLEVRGDACLPTKLHVALYRVTQEALNNVARHARASTARVDLEVTAQAVRLVIADDGRGFEPGHLDATHLGLRSMRERAEEAGAELRLITAPGRGTQVLLDWRDGG